MSVEAVTWALSVPVGGSAKVVLIGLANHAHPDGREAYPSLDTLAGYAHCDRATARRKVRQLQGLGWIEEDGYGPRGTIKWYLRVDISLAYRRECVYCGAPASVLDHVVPRSQGGSDSLRNLVAACAPCNVSKGTKDVRSWVEAGGGSWPEVERRMARFWSIDAEGGKLPPVSTRPQQVTSRHLPRAPVPPEPSVKPSENQKPPPPPPQAGGSGPDRAPKVPPGKRQRAALQWRHAVDLWAKRHFPDVGADVVRCFVSEHAGTPTADELRSWAQKRGPAYADYLAPPS